MDNRDLQIGIYLHPLITGANRNVYSALNYLDSMDLTDDTVFIGSNNYSKEVFIHVLLNLKQYLSYRVLPLSRLNTINNRSDEEFASLTALTDVKVLFLVSGGVDQVPYIGNIIDVVVDSRRLLGLRTYIFHMGDKKEFVDYKSTYMKKFLEVKCNVGIKKGGQI